MALLVDINLLERFEQTVDNMVAYFVDNLPELIFSLIILMVTIFVAKIVDNRITKYSGKFQKGMRMDPTKFTMLKHISVGFVYIIGFILIFYTIPGLHALSSTLLASVGILGLVLGIAAQDTFGNIISGIALVFFQPFRVGDLITVGTNYGRVTDVNLRQTTILTADNRYILIPNSSLNKETVINWTYDDTLVRWSCTIPISHNSNIDRAREIMLEEARKNQYVLSREILERKHVNFSADVRARVSDVTPLGVIMLLDFWVDDRDNAVPAEYAIREAIQKRFYDDPDVSTPLPHYVFSRDDKTDISSHL
ncbi:mechanosensitive ion channel family protein [Methanimicrococcus blatticola]|uniref:Mechanosensitive ion channel-like protein n=1 Tax=Methanimicrococcus blatticola TaxID=91560 RepID=A0A484F6M4_9EURY|nr:mechanosensitive ion channel family protein [Methanimicrococcus blatticola]MBZ3934981.1 mechanosensitive ion channel family protein [Methanimicrococcus blatticola]MCC2508921.1 mechanosensitive ion channel family protein [Methanimicrococcus blatticola]TDQ71052.1 mechanosensitive ion channel-like protein [Methanimicrococcus blatticola]